MLEKTWSVYVIKLPFIEKHIYLTILSINPVYNFSAMHHFIA